MLDGWMTIYFVPLFTVRWQKKACGVSNSPLIYRVKKKKLRVAFLCQEDFLKIYKLDSRV